MFPIFAGSNPSGYNLTRSLRFRSSASAYLSRTPASAGNRQIFTLSAWVKRGTLGARQGIIVCTDAPANNYFDIEFIAADQLDIQGSNGTWRLATSAVYRDPSAWYHIVLAVDTTQATASNRVKLYVNGSQVTAFSTASYPTLNSNCYFNLNAAHSIGSWQPASGLYLDGYLTEVNFIDGQALTPSSFGSTNALTGVWQPARYTGTYGTNGFYLPFTDNSALTTSSNVGLGKDFSGNGNYWTTNNISITSGVTYDSMTDVPTLTSATAANYCVLSPLDISTSNSQRPTDGNLTYPVSGAFQYSARGTIFVTSGKWYAEFTISSSSAIVAVVNANAILFGLTGSNGVFALTTQIFNNSGTAAQTGLAAFAASDVIGVAFDAGANTVQFYKNNATYGTALTISGFAAPYAFQTGSNGAVCTINANFGQRPFAYTPPTGYVALNTFNLPTGTILKGNTVMDATLYTGTGASLSVTNAASFKPDLVWIKSRSAATDHAWYDSVRGTTKQLESNTTTAETTEATGLTAFGSAGFTVGALAQMNTSAATYVGWQWQAGQGSSSSNTNGTITSTVSVNASAGFSVVTYTGTGANATVGHGLGVAPSFYIVKSRNPATPATDGFWVVYTAALGAGSALLLNSTNAINTSGGWWSNTAPTSSVFSIGTDVNVSGNGVNFVAYCWTPIAGYSAFGSYTGNSSTDGPFVYTGFRPKYLLVRRTDATASWIVFDSARDTYNAVTKLLRPNLSDAEITGADIALDFLSNGFKLRQTSNNINTGTIIYMAFAESPFKNALAR